MVTFTWANGLVGKHISISEGSPIPPTERTVPVFSSQSLIAPITHFNNTIVGTTVAHLSDEDLRSITILVPNQAISQQTIDLFNPLFSEEINLLVKDANLRRTRDLLLPKLISGEVAVDGLEIAVK